MPVASVAQSLVGPLSRSMRQCARGSRGDAAAIRALFANGEQGAWYDPSDLASLYQDAQGTLPVTRLGQPVGLMLDKRFGLARGPNLWSGGSTFGETVRLSETGFRVVRTGATPSGFRTDGKLIAGKVYEVTAQFADAHVALSLAFGGSAITFGGRAIIVALGPNIAFAAVGEGYDVTVTDVSVRELPGNHALQTTATARPTLQARVNLLIATDTFELSAGGWGATGLSITPTAHSIKGSTYYEAAKLTSDSNASLRHNLLGASAAGVREVCSIALRAGTASSVNLGIGAIEDVGGGIWGGADRCTARVVSGPGRVEVTGPGLALVTGLSQTQDTEVEWTRRYVTSGLRSGPFLYPAQSSSTMIGASILIARPQAERGEAATPYQRVDSAGIYADIGLPRYLQFDGIDDWMTTTYTPGLAWSAAIAAYKAPTPLGSSFLFESRGGASAYWGAGPDRIYAFLYPSQQAGMVYHAFGTTAVWTHSVSGDLIGAGPLSIMARAPGSSGVTFMTTGRLFGLVFRGALSAPGELAILAKYLAPRAGVTL